jgi:hypothetical protein
MKNKIGLPLNKTSFYYSPSVLLDPTEYLMHLYQQMSTSTWAAIGVALGVLGIFLLEIFAVLAWA